MNNTFYQTWLRRLGLSFIGVAASYQLFLALSWIVDQVMHEDIKMWNSGWLIHIIMLLTTGVYTFYKVHKAKW